MSQTIERSESLQPETLRDHRAVISENARLDPTVRVGAYAVVGDGVELAADCVISPHAVVQGPARFGHGNIFHPFCSVGGAPQDLKYRGEPTRLEVGDRNVFREGVTVSRGTVQGGGLTRIGDDNLFMTGAHIAHDCVVGTHTIFANSATLAGHVSVEDFASVGAFSPVHQFCRVGRFAYIGACTVITQDVPPFSRVVTERNTHCYGVNTIGLERQGFTPERIKAIEQAFRLLLRSKLNTTQALEQMRATLDSPDAARSQGIEMAVIALREEAAPELASLTPRLHWVGLGELSRTLELLHQEGVTHAVMAGQVKHNKIFSAIRPDWKLAKLLFSLPRKNTDSLIGAVARVLEDEGIHLVDSTSFLQPLVPAPGVLTRRAPDAREAADIAYGREIARQIAGLDLGQTVVIRDLACVAVEAMEGTDETMERAARLVGSAGLVVVKVAKPKQDMRFDVPVVGLRTVETMVRCKATALAIDAGRTLVFDRPKLVQAADEAGIAIEAFAGDPIATPSASGPGG